MRKKTIPINQGVEGKKGKHFINNAEFHQLLKEYRERKKENPDERIPESIGKIINELASRLAKHPSFYRIEDLEDKIQTGIYHCLRYVDNYDPDRYQNPFSFFTSIIFYNSFLQGIKKDKQKKELMGEYQDYLSTNYVVRIKNGKRVLYEPISDPIEETIMDTFPSTPQDILVWDDRAILNFDVFTRFFD